MDFLDTVFGNFNTAKYFVLVCRVLAKAFNLTQNVWLGADANSSRNFRASWAEERIDDGKILDGDIGFTLEGEAGSRSKAETFRFCGEMHYKTLTTDFWETCERAKRELVCERDVRSVL